MKRKKQKLSAMHNTGADRYLITYADLITLLLGLFVILYATSEVNAEKFKEFSTAFTEYFKSKDQKAGKFGDGVLDGTKNAISDAIITPAPQKNIEEITELTKKALASYMQSGNIELVESNEGLKIIMSEKLLFKSAKATIEQQGSSALDSIAKILQNSSQKILIDGHTDADPIHTFSYESNWHLSAMRATNVAYYLVQKGLPEYNLMIRGFGSQRPIADNTSVEGKAANRRVEIFIKDATADSPSNSGYTE